MSRKHVTSETRRSTAAQFFMDEEVAETDVKTTSDKVVELINQTTIGKDVNRVQNLKKVQELIIHKEPALLDNFLDEILAFQHDISSDVRKFIVGFIEESCKKDPDILPKVVANLNMMLDDEAVAVQKKVIQAATQLYKVALQWLCRAKLVDDIMESTWAYMSQLKTRIIALLESENDGIRTHTVKFMEMIVIVQTYPDADSPKKGESDIALDDVPLTLKIARPRKLHEEAKHVFEALLIFHGTPHITSVNLMTCMQSLVLIARYRSEFMSKVIQALEALHANLPPTLAKSQVSSVRKHLKLQLITLLKLPAAGEFYPQISTLLTDLGATTQEISKYMPKGDDIRKRQRITDESSSAKRLKLDEIEMDDEKDEEIEPPPPEISKSATNTAIDITANDVYPRLSSINVTDLVLISMLSLPDLMPAHFQASYTPIAVAGTSPQIKHLARLLATQLTAAGLGKGVEEIVKMGDDIGEIGFDDDEIAANTNLSIQTVVGGTTVEQKKRKVPVVLLPTGAQGKAARRQKQLNLREITKPLSEQESNILVANSMERILNAERCAALSGASQVRTKILSNLATQFRGEISYMLKEFIFDDLRNRVELAFSWLYEEYAVFQGFSQIAPRGHIMNIDNYEDCVIGLLEGLLQKGDQKDRDILFSRFFLEIPCVTEKLLEILKRFCQDEDTVVQGIVTLKLLVECRPPKQLPFLSVISELTLHEKTEVRNHAIKATKQLHERGDLRQYIENFALRSIKFLLNPAPPIDIILDPLRPPPLCWTEETIKICLHLYLSLLPVNHRLIHDLAAAYVGTVADIKRIILRILEGPVKGMGMSSPELLLLVENCPKGAETLVTRIIHILTDKAPPSAELVARVRDLYHKRVPDVRFLIPVLNGLTKKEVIAALPKLIKLNPIVVKEVFNRLLGSHIETGSSFTSPLTPAELLISLHNLDPSKCDMKTIIKATSLCFAEKHVYTQEVLAVVMQQLMEQNPLPTLLMRTVIQSLSLYPRLIGFVMNILQRLILKQVWKQKKVWEGFIKCCQRTKPQSFQVLLQLPPPQLLNVFEVSPDLQEPLTQHVESFTEHQRAHIPQAIMDILNVEDQTATDEGLDAGNELQIETIENDEPPPPGQEML